MATIAQSYLLLLLDDESGKPLIADGYIKHGLAAAVLADLGLAGRIELTGKKGLFNPGTIAVASQKPVGDAAADVTLQEIVADKPRTVYVLVAKIAREIRPRVVDQLVAANIVRREEGRVLGIFPREYWPAESMQLENEARAGLRRVLIEGQPATAEQAALIGILNATTGLAKALPGEDRRMIRSRAKEVAKMEGASEEAKELVSDIVAALVSLMSAPTATTV